MSRIQEWFDRSSLGIIAQGGPSIDLQTEVCRYRGDNGRKCAVGQLVDGDVGPLDEALVGSELLSLRGGYGDLDGEERIFLSELQNIHDLAAFQSRPPSKGPLVLMDGPEFFLRWLPRVRSLANSYRLNVDLFERNVAEAGVDPQLVLP